MEWNETKWMKLNCIVLYWQRQTKSHSCNLSGKVAETHTTMKIGNKNKNAGGALANAFEFAMCGHTIVTMITIYEIVNVSIACVLNCLWQTENGKTVPQYTAHSTQTNVHQMELNIDE